MSFNDTIFNFTKPSFEHFNFLNRTLKNETNQSVLNTSTNTPSIIQRALHYNPNLFNGKFNYNKPNFGFSIQINNILNHLNNRCI